MGDERTAAPASGGFDKPIQTEEPPAVLPEKQDFKEPFKEHAETLSDRISNQKGIRVDPGEKAAADAAAALNKQGPDKDMEAELEEMDKISPEDLDLAEQMVFKGFAEFDVEMSNLPNHKFTICSTNAEEMNMIDEIIFDMVKRAEDKEDGTVDLPQNQVQAMRNALFVAISYKGRNKEEVMDDSSCYLNTIKKAIIRISELENLGQIDESKKLKTSLKKSLIRRATAIKRMPTPVIDFLSGEKYAFDAKMYKIMSTKNVLPKS